MFLSYSGRSVTFPSFRHVPVVPSCSGRSVMFRVTRGQPSEKRDPARVLGNSDQEEGPMKKRSSKKVTRGRPQREEDDRIQKKTDRPRG
ncbi:hypothetical protein Pcinc_030409 [Petrolisthes cinctipes]|uniref:Uncharacterized protein n=1 Tax=Petrolisthes cinctipes TaxID=88211 RepID=A0AAE1K2M1_PETCI|nr:hypothetical protein Pcinc_030409 [Petrolisthes cinctipes]